MSNLFDFIYKLEKSTPSHIAFRIFGIRFNCLRPSIKKERKKIAQYYQSFENASLIPKATGGLRLVQDANIGFLKIFDEICTKNNWQYWLDYGTLIGAIRHKGFIPWDDDIDISMPRDDYEELIEKYSNVFDEYPDFKLTFENNRKSKCFIKLEHKKSQNLFIDIFPYDYYHCDLDETGKFELSQKLNNIKKEKLKKKFNTIEEVRNNFKKITKEVILENKEPNKNASLFMAIDFPHSHKNRVMGNNEIFPLQRVQFENGEFLAPNNIQSVLEKEFGDYMKIPKDSYPRHSNYNNISDEEKEILQKLAN